MSSFSMWIECWSVRSNSDYAPRPLPRHQNVQKTHMLPLQASSRPAGRRCRVRPLPPARCFQDGLCACWMFWFSAGCRVPAQVTSGLVWPFPSCHECPWPWAYRGSLPGEPVGGQSHLPWSGWVPASPRTGHRLTKGSSRLALLSEGLCFLETLLSHRTPNNEPPRLLRIGDHSHGLYAKKDGSFFKIFIGV